MSVSYGKQLSGIRTESAAPPASQVKQQRHHYHRHRTTAKKAEVLSNHRTSQRARRGEVSGNRRLTCEVSVPSRRRMMPGLIIFALLCGCCRVARRESGRYTDSDTIRRLLAWPKK